MVIDTQEERLDSIERLEQFLEGTVGVSLRVPGGETDRQEHVRRVLARFNYTGLVRRDKGVVVRYLQYTGGYSRQHLVRLDWAACGAQTFGQRKALVAAFYRRYTEVNVQLYVAVGIKPSG